MLPSKIEQKDWTAVKGEIQKTWSGLTSEELEQTHGDISELTTLVERQSGASHEEVEKKLDEVIARCGTEAPMNGFITPLET